MTCMSIRMNWRWLSRKMQVAIKSYSRKSWTIYYLIIVLLT
ncbi:hypothetical protein EG68_09187 [Paragonimus skrjabini miyazakii]|uniref:Uncharacterized protein n=1 Tax=Paragonimus skrjabini miyazakii TaxID=59628 RepID=A0A8S9YI91_9TREM|nr:hypothetical protein EG68_09187 [Paragonimus skrjabini miyazakii]